MSYVQQDSFLEQKKYGHREASVFF